MGQMGVSDRSATARIGDGAKRPHLTVVSTTAEPAPKVRFLGLGFDPLGLEEAIGFIAARGTRLEAFAFVTTPNVDHRVRLEREPNLIHYYNKAWLTLCDSRVLPLLARATGVRLSVASGADIVEALFRDEIESTEPVVIVGGTRAIVESLKLRYKLRDVRWHDAPMGLRDNPAAIKAAAEFVAANPSRFVFIAVGSPQQEMIACAIADLGTARGVGICCGASLEFLSGQTPRAPKWMRDVALEWLHRLITKPRKMARRYLVDGPMILPIWLMQGFGGKLNDKKSLG